MTHRTSLCSILAALFMLGSACGGSGAGKGSGGSSSGGTTSSGGNGSGGTSATGGQASGGTTASGGSASGGATVSGGTISQSGGASGGTVASGGTTPAGGGAGGTSPGTGGTLRTGGAGGSGTSVTGGTQGRGGTAATGGAQGTGGVLGAGGSTGNACTGTASGTAANTLTVNVDSAQYVVPDPIFGLLMERLGKNWSGGLFVGANSTIPNTNGMRNDVIAAFKEAGVGMIEWPGGCAAGGYNWSSNKAPSNDVGTDRYMELCALLGIEPYIVGPGTASAATNNYSWVTYINDNPTHPEWHLKYFKVGNEVWGCGGNQTEATYETNYKANYDKLSVPVKDKKLTIIASTGLIGNWTWLDAQLKNQASIIDGIEIHDYIYHPSGSDAPIPNVGFSDAQYYNIVNAANKGQMGPRLDQIISTLDKYDPEKRIKIWEDEWGDWTLPFNNASDGWLQQGTVMDAISAAETLHLFLSHADRIAMAGLAQGINVIHSLLLTRSTDSALVKTPTFYVFKMFLAHHRSNAKWAPNTLKSENITGNGQTFPVLSAGTTVDDQGRINISLANVDLVNIRTIQVTINSSKSSYDASIAQVITGPAKDSYNDYAQAEKVNIQPLDAASCSISGKSLQVTLPSKSVVMVVLTPKG